MCITNLVYIFHAHFRMVAIHPGSCIFPADSVPCILAGSVHSDAPMCCGTSEGPGHLPRVALVHDQMHSACFT